MKNIFKTTLISLCLAAAWGCSDDKFENPFKGADNYILEFSLDKGGSLYPAYLADGQIIISVPAGTVLSGATARYRVSEQSYIIPDPKTLTDWDSEQMFRVVSYDDNPRDYKYTIVYSDIAAEGTVHLSTQAEVDEFGTSRTSVIEGSLVIGPAATDDPITDLSPLSNLREVRYNITLGAAFAGKDLAGFANLERAGGIFIGNMNTETATADSLWVELPSLTVSGDVVVNCPTVKSFIAPQLGSAGNLFFNCKALEELDLARLTECLGDLTVQSISGTTISAVTANYGLKQINLPRLATVGGGVTIQNMYYLSSVELPLLRTAGGRIMVHYNRDMTRIDLPLLARIGGALTVTNNNSLEYMSMPELTRASAVAINPQSASYSNLTQLDLSGLVEVDGDLSMNYFSCEELVFEKLALVGGKIDIRTSPTLSRLGFPALRSCNNIYLYTLSALPSLDISGIESLQKTEIISCYDFEELICPVTITGDLTINAGSREAKEIRYKGLERVEGAFTLQNFTANTTYKIEGIKYIGKFTSPSIRSTYLKLSDVEEIGSFELSSTYVVTFDAPALTQVNEAMTFSSCYALTDIRLPLLTRIGGLFRYAGASYAEGAASCLLTTMDGFTRLSEAGGVSIEYCGNLTDYTALAAVAEFVGPSGWNIVGCKYNPTHEDMQNGRYKQ